MHTLYPTTALEDWVTTFYHRLRINKPYQINEEYIAKIYGIYITRTKLPSNFQVVGRFRRINIDSRKSSEEQREIFFHELCHLLRHTGVQTMMPYAFRQLQEWDARNFVRYAAIPHHMLEFLDFEDPYVINKMQRLFKVTPELCMERLEQINKRIHVYQGNRKHLLVGVENTPLINLERKGG